MIQNLGYTKPLFILPFDHRLSFSAKGGPASGWENISSLKQIIYEAFKKSLEVVPSEDAAILIDEQYGDEILKDAKQNGFTVLLTTEKSGQEDFIFEYGEDFQSHIEKYNPTFVKALIRVQNGVSEISKTNLKKLSEYCQSKNYKFLLEVLADGKLDFILKTISELQNFGIEPDVWKIEGMDNSLDYEKIVRQIRKNGRENVSLVILGRGEEKEKVEDWIKAGRNVNGVIGFAIGRTIFWEPLMEFTSGKINRETAVEQISQNYIHFYNLFTSSK